MSKPNRTPQQVIDALQNGYLPDANVQDAIYFLHQANSMNHPAPPAKRRSSFFALMVAGWACAAFAGFWSFANSREQERQRVASNAVFTTQIATLSTELKSALTTQNDLLLNTKEALSVSANAELVEIKKSLEQMQSAIAAGSKPSSAGSSGLQPDPKRAGD